MKPEMLTSKSEKKSKQKNFSQWFLFQRISISISGRSTECRTEVSHMGNSIVNWEVLSQVLFGEYWLCGLVLYINLFMLHTLVLTLIWTLSNWRVILNKLFSHHTKYSVKNSVITNHIVKLQARQAITQSCPTLCNPMDCSLPGFSVHGVFQARVLEWVAISFSRGSSCPRDPTQVFCIAGRRFTLWATKEAHSKTDTFANLPAYWSF